MNVSATFEANTKTEKTRNLESIVLLRVCFGESRPAAPGRYLPLAHVVFHDSPTGPQGVCIFLPSSRKHCIHSQYSCSPQSLDLS